MLIKRYILVNSPISFPIIYLNILFITSYALDMQSRIVDSTLTQYFNQNTPAIVVGFGFSISYKINHKLISIKLICIQ